MAQKCTSVLEGECFNIDDGGIQARRLNRVLPLLDVFSTCRDQQYVHQFGVIFVRADDFIIETDLFHRKGNVLISLDFDLPFEVPFG